MIPREKKKKNHTLSGCRVAVVPLSVAGKLSLTPDVTIILCGVPNPLNPPPPHGRYRSVSPLRDVHSVGRRTASSSADACIFFFFFYCGWIGFKRQRRHRKISNGNFKDHTHTQTHSFPPVSAQTAEQMTLTEACKCAKDKLVNIYTDSHYAYGIKHGSGTHWSHR